MFQKLNNTLRLFCSHTLATSERETVHFLLSIRAKPNSMRFFGKGAARTVLRRQVIIIIVVVGDIASEKQREAPLARTRARWWKVYDLVVVKSRGKSASEYRKIKHASNGACENFIKKVYCWKGIVYTRARSNVSPIKMSNENVILYIKQGFSFS